jgi:hypothetical protein
MPDMPHVSCFVSMARGVSKVASDFATSAICYTLQYLEAVRAQAPCSQLPAADAAVHAVSRRLLGSVQHTSRCSWSSAACCKIKGASTYIVCCLQSACMLTIPSSCGTANCVGQQQEPNIQLALSAISQLVNSATPHPAPAAAWPGALWCQLLQAGRICMAEQLWSI